MQDLDTAQAEIRHLETQLERLERGALDPELFKKLRLQYGVYSMRRAPSAYMVRVRVRLGILQAGQLEALAEVCERLAPGRACHLTTRQAVQLYGVERAVLPTLLRCLAAAGLTTREASGNVVRNITCCPWAGVAPEEAFDVTPYAQAVGEYLLRNPLTQLLPRKIKIAFEGCPVDHARTPIHDLGIVGILHEGRPAFRISIGGGLGPQPRAAQLLEPVTPVDWLLPTVDAVLRVFERAGERRNRARARLKFLVETLGWEEFQRRVLAERPAVWATQSGHALRLGQAATGELAVTRAFHAMDVERPDALARWCATNVAAQKQPGFASILVRVPYGDLSVAQLRGLAAMARTFAGGVRLTNTQNVLLRFVPRAAVSSVYEALEPLRLAEPWAERMADVTRCPGAESCLSAITRPRGLAEAIEALCHNGLSSMADASLSLKFSGCPNACGQHHIADIGGFGVSLRVGERYVPCYQLLVGGGTSSGNARFGQRLARVPAQWTPEAVRRLVVFYRDARQPEETFGAFVARVGIPTLQETLGNLPEVNLQAVQRDPQLCTDLGAEEPFVPDAGKGECAA